MQRGSSLRAVYFFGVTLLPDHFTFGSLFFLAANILLILKIKTVNVRNGLGKVMEIMEKNMYEEFGKDVFINVNQSVSSFILSKNPVDPGEIK